MTTAARTEQDRASHYYYPDGTPCYEVENKSKGGMRKTTLADAKKLGLLPSVTTILSILDKPALTAWKVEQGVLAALTTPRNPGEELDAFVYRVLHEERQQDQEAQKAMDRGTEIHAALESLMKNEEVSDEMWEWCGPAYEAICKYGTVLGVERVLIGHGYAGRCDLITQEHNGNTCWLWDWKSTKKLPKQAYSEHLLQVNGGYAAAYAQDQILPIRTGNVYISTLEKGKFVVCEHDTDWRETYHRGFEPIVRHWQWANDYRP